jgi:hypothetical protein
MQSCLPCSIIHHLAAWSCSPEANAAAGFSIVNDVYVMGSGVAWANRGIDISMAMRF